VDGMVGAARPLADYPETADVQSMPAAYDAPRTALQEVISRTCLAYVPLQFRNPPLRPGCFHSRKRVRCKIIIHQMVPGEFPIGVVKWS
jgi:hypothetical protein